MSCKSIKHLVCGLLLVLCVPNASAKVIESKSILNQMIQSYQGVYQFYMETNVMVFDPEVFAPLDEEIEEGFSPYEIVENRYEQKIVWVRDEYQMIETLDKEGVPLHYYIKESTGQTQSGDLTAVKSFSDFDVLFPHLIFYTKYASYLKTRLAEMGILVSDEVEIVPDQYEAVYRLGSDQNFILVDPDSFRVTEINIMIQVGGRYYPLRIEFSDWDPSITEIPRQTKYFINSRLVKTIQVTTHQRGMGSERNAFLESYREKLVPAQPYSIDIYYGR